MWSRLEFSYLNVDTGLTLNCDMEESTMPAWIKASLVSALLATFLVACESSDSPGNSLNRPINDSVNTNPTILNGTTPYIKTDVNGALKGEVWSAKKGTRLNLETGEVKYVSTGKIYPRADGTEYAELFPDFQYYSDGGCGGWPGDSHAIFIRDTATGKVSESIEVFAKLSGPVLISPNGERMVLFATGSDVCGDQYDYYVTLLSRSGELLATATERVIGYDWMPDSKLAYLVLRNDVYSLVIEGVPNSFAGRVSTTIPDLGGDPSRFRVSPDGTQVLIEVVTDVPLAISGLQFRDATVWQMDIDGANLRKLVDTSRVSPSDNTSYDDPRVNAPVWSPDSSHMLVTEDYILGAAVSYYGTETENLTYIESVGITAISNDSVTYVMPTDSEPQRLPPASYSATGVRPLFGQNTQGKNGILGINPIDRQIWTPAIADNVPANGGFPAPSGQINRGQTGVLYNSALRESGMAGIPIEVTDLATSTVKSIELKVDDDSTYVSGYDVSADRERIVALHSDSEQLNAYDANGELIESLSTISTNYDYSGRGRIKISPTDNDVVAWLFGGTYSSYQGVAMVNTDTRRFVEIFEDRDYDTFAFLPNGDLLLVNANRVLIAKKSFSGYSDPEIAFVHNEYLEHVAVRTSDNRLAYSSRGRIFTIDIDGNNLTSVTAASTYLYEHPEWSPDGKTLVFRGTGADSIVSNKSFTYFVSADAENVALYGDYIQHEIMQLGEASGQEEREVGLVSWR